MADLDRLEVQVEASAAKANAELNKLVNKLDKVASSLSGINSSGLVGFANGIEKLGKSMQTVNSIKTTDFTRLAKNIEKLSNLNTAGLNTVSSGLILFGKSLANFGAAAKSAESIATMAKNISKLGGKNVQNAIDSMPRLATALKELMTTLAQAPNVSKNVIQMTRALADLSNALRGAQNGGAGSGGNNGGAGANNINRLSAAFARLTGKITKSSRSMKSFSQIVGKFYVNCFLIIRALKMLGKAISTSMDYVETYNYFAVTMDKIGREFGNMYAQYGYDSAEAYAESFTSRMNELTRKMTGYKVGSNGELTLTDSIGLALDPEAIMNYQSGLAAVTNSVGLIGENSVNVSKALTMLAADMSSLKNIDLKTVMTNFQSGLIGQSRALYKYGIDITNATLQTYAYDLGLSKAVSEMTQAEKMQLRMIAILDQSKVAWGDQANTINSVANQYRIMKQQLSNLARTIGNLFLPIIQKVLPVVNGLIIALQRLFTMLGFKLWGGNWLKDTMNGISGGYADDSLSGLEDDADSTTDALGNAAKAAEKLKTTVLGIDELNINAPQEESGSGNGTGGAGDTIDLSNAIAGALEDYESVWDEAFANAQNKAQEYADAICNFFGRMWNAIEPFREAVGRLWNEGLKNLMEFSFQNLKNFYDEFLVPIGMWAFGTEGAGLTRLVDIINNQLLRIDWEGITGNLKAFWQAIEPYAEQFGEGLIDFFEDLSGIAVDVINSIFGEGGAITNITDWLNDHDPESAREWGYAFGILATGIIALQGLGSIIAGIAGFGMTLAGIASGLEVLFGTGGIVAKIGSAISGAFGGLFSISAPLAVAIAAVAFAVLDLWQTSEGFRDAVGDAFSRIFDTLSSVFSDIVEKILGVVESIKKLISVVYEIYDNSPLKDLIEIIGIIGAKLAGLLASAFLTAIGDMILGFCDVLQGSITIVTGFLEVLSGLANFDGEMIITGFNDISNGIKEVFHGLFEFFAAIPAQFLEIGKEIISGLWQGITDKVASVKKGIGDLCTGFVGWFKEALDIHSPSRKMAEIGDYAILGLVEPFGNTGGLEQIQVFANSMLNLITQTLSPDRFALMGQEALSALLSNFSLETLQPAFGNINLALQAAWGETMVWWQETAMPMWFEQGILPWFSQEKWITVTNGMKLGILTKWTEFSVLWKANLQKWWNTDVMTWFTVVRWSAQGENMRRALTDKWLEFARLWHINIIKWWNEDVTVWFTVAKWTAFGENMKNGLYTGFKGIVQMVGSIMNGIIDIFNTGLKQIESAINALVSEFNSIAGELGVSKLSHVHAQNIAHVKIPAFAEGGYPNTGELFLARENGINEMIGRIGSRSAVANNDQITDAIRAAVVQGMDTEEQNELLREQNSLLRAILAKDNDVVLDGKSLVNGIDKARKRMGWNFQAT